MDRKRVVITGMGTINALGHTIDAYWQGLISGTSGIRRISGFDASDLPCQIGGEVLDFDVLDYMDRKSARRVSRSTQFAVAAARQALENANLPYPMTEPERAGVIVGTAVAGVDHILEGNQVFLEKGYSRLKPYQVPSGIPNIPAFAIAREFQCLGPNNTSPTACAAGTQAIGEGAELIRRGAADIVIAAGAEAIIVPLVIGTFCVIRALPFNYNDRPEKASRPFNIDREGFVLSEGSAALILESLDHALDRGAHIYAEVLGHSSSSDGYDLVAMRPDGSGAVRAMRWALQDAGVLPGEIDYINAHGTSTPLNDKTETLAIKSLFGDGAYNVPVGSTKSMMGHAMGASGALEAVACTLVINHGIIPPTINYENPDPECDLYYVPNEAVQHKVDIALSNSFGLGGQNACLVLKRYDGEN
jgi:beta-ketoacyl-acyl-carrier-protein synthase II